jgi:hypothetical protein
MPHECLLINKMALRAIRRGELEPFIAREVGHNARESDHSPGLREVPLESSLIERIRRRAALENLTISNALQQIARKEIRLDE